ncbi:MAG TPA: M48 family metallopeptidase [Firmicutes bacterium]|nr:M48 family metallopeptidase [Bacillota bacterium]
MGSSKIFLIVLGAAFLIIAALFLGAYSRPVFSAEALALFDADFLERAADYQRASLRISLMRTLINWAGLGALVFFGWNYFSRFRPPLLTAAACIALIFIALYLLTLPLDYYRGFVLEHRFGLSTQTFASWLADNLKSSAVSLVISVMIFTGFYALVKYFPLRWWIYAGVISIFLMLAGSYLYPLLIDPLFYRFEPMRDEGMNTRILDMAEQAGIQVREVLVADASRRTVKANAYFTGLGSSKRIVVYDTLLTGFSREEALAVIAHEIAHWKYSHILKGILLSAVQIFISLYLLFLVLQESGITGMAAAGSRADFRVVATALLFITLLSFVALPIQNAVSRSFERQADRAAIELTGSKELHVTLHRNLARANLGDVDPHPLVKAILYTHPSTLERIKLAE